MNEAAFEPAQMAPHSQDAEEAFLGSILINPALLAMIMLFLTAEDFFILRNAWVYEAMLRLHERGEEIDYLTLIEELRGQDRLDDIGGIAYITYLTSNVGTSMYAETYAKIIYRAARRRGLLDASSDIARLARDEEKPIEVIIDLVENTLAAETGKFRQGLHSGLLPMDHVVKLAVDQYPQEDDTPEAVELGAMVDAYEAYQEQSKRLLKAGYTDMDKLITLIPGLHHFCARPGNGKSLFMQNLVYNKLIAPFVVSYPPETEGDWIQLKTSQTWVLLPGKYDLEALLRLAYFSAEMTMPQIMSRWYAMITGVPTDTQLTGEMSYDQFADVEVAKKLMKALKSCLLLRSGQTTPRQILAEIRLWQPDAAIVDYTQKLRGNRNKYNNRYDEVSEICSDLQDIAIKENIPVVSGAQVGRSGDNKMPTLSDIKETGRIEEDSDSVTFFHVDKDQPNSLLGKVAKQRNGKTGTFVLAHKKDRMRLLNGVVTKHNTNGATEQAVATIDL